MWEGGGLLALAVLSCHVHGFLHAKMLRKETSLFLHCTILACLVNTKINTMHCYLYTYRILIFFLNNTISLRLKNYFLSFFSSHDISYAVFNMNTPNNTTWFHNKNAFLYMKQLWIQLHTFFVPWMHVNVNCKNVFPFIPTYFLFTSFCHHYHHNMQ